MKPWYYWLVEETTKGNSMPPQKTLSLMNISRVLRSVWTNSPVSRIDISKSLGLDKSTVTHIVNELLVRQLVVEKEEGVSGPLGGRKPVFLEVNASRGWTAGIELQPDRVTVHAVNLHGETLFSYSNRQQVSGANLVDTLVGEIESLKKRNDELGFPLLGAGVGLSGIVETSRGRIVESAPLGLLTPLDVAGPVSARVGLPLLVENDANCCCWGELSRGRNHRSGDFLSLLVEFRDEREYPAGCSDVAVGIGFVLGGRVYSGARSSAGEFRSLFWQEPNRGQFSLTNAELGRVVRDDKLFERFARELVQHIAFLVNTLSLDQVVIGGVDGAKAGLLSELLKEGIRRNWAYPDEVHCSVLISEFGENAVAFGAAGMFLERLFGIPDISSGDDIVPAGVEALSLW